MPNLDNIHFKFFPKAKTASMGKKLIIFAWIIELVVASMAFTMAMFFIFSSIKDTGDGPNYDVMIMGLAFFAVTIMELTKIPLATAFYYAGLWYWRAAFIIALFLVNFSTFETMIQGFELSYNTQQIEVDEKRIELESIEEDISNLEIKKDDSKITQEIKNEKILFDDVMNDQTKLSNAFNKDKESEQIFFTNERTRLNNEANDARRDLGIQSGVSSPKIKRLEGYISDNDNKIIELNIKQEKYIEDGQLIKPNKYTGFMSQDKKNRKLEYKTLAQQAQNDINKLDEEITGYKDEIDELEKAQILGNDTSTIDQNLKIDLAQVNKNEENRLKTLESQYKSNLSTYEQEAIAIKKRIETKSQRLQGNINLAENRSTQISILQDEYVQTLKEYNTLAQKNRIYRLAHKINLAAEWLGGEWTLFGLFGSSNTVVLNEVGVANVMETTFVKEEHKPITQAELDRAFWLWFGTLAFIVSVIGTLVAFAGLHLQDERMHEIRNKPIKNTGKLFRTLRKFPFFINKLLWATYKRLLKPVKVYEDRVVEKIVEKIVEKPVEVIVEVERIVEKLMIEEKIVFQRIEVPKEVVRKEIVYVPLPTDDAAVLKKGPYKIKSEDEEASASPYTLKSDVKED